MIKNNENTEVMELIDKIKTFNLFMSSWSKYITNKMYKEKKENEGRVKNPFEINYETIWKSNLVEMRIIPKINKTILKIESDYEEIMEEVIAVVEHELINWLYELVGKVSSIIILITKELDNQRYLVYEDYIKVLNNLQSEFLKDIASIKKLETEEVS